MNSTQTSASTHPTPDYAGLDGQSPLAQAGAQALRELGAVINPSRAERLRVHAALLAPVYAGELPARVRASEGQVWRLETEAGSGPWFTPGLDRRMLGEALTVSEALGAPHHCGLPAQNAGEAHLSACPSPELLLAWYAPVWNRLARHGLKLAHYVGEVHQGAVQSTFNPKRVTRLSLSSLPGGDPDAGFTAEELEAAGIRTDIWVRLAYSDALVHGQLELGHTQGVVSQAVLDRHRQGPRGAAVAHKHRAP